MNGRLEPSVMPHPTQENDCAQWSPSVWLLVCLPSLILLLLQRRRWWCMSFMAVAPPQWAPADARLPRRANGSWLQFVTDAPTCTQHIPMSPMTQPEETKTNLSLQVVMPGGGSGRRWGWGERVDQGQHRLYLVLAPALVHRSMFICLWCDENSVSSQRFLQPRTCLTAFEHTQKSSYTPTWGIWPLCSFLLLFFFTFLSNCAPDFRMLAELNSALPVRLVLSVSSRQSVFMQAVPSPEWLFFHISGRFHMRGTL